QPGEKVQLLINTDRADATVLLFVRPANGIYLPPRVVRMDGKSTIQEIEVSQKDMPNFFVEAVTIADGKVHQVAKEIVVPPEKRVLTVEVEPSSESYRPGQDAKVKLKLADFEGKPFVGSTVVAIYDKSVEYISGGSNVPEIKEFFWKWRRHHHPQTEHNLQRGSGNIVPPNEKGMSDLGAFGATVALELSSMTMDGAVRMGGMGGYGGEAMMQRRGGVAMFGAAPASVPMAADAMEMMVPESEKAPGSGAAMRPMAANFKAEAGAPGQPLVQPTVRTEFADTALWAGAVETSADGTAEVALKMPENLTTWRIKVWGMGHGTKVGEGATDVVTRKDLIIRLQAPRFFIERDEVVLSANVHNYLKSAKNVEVALELDGGAIEPMGELVQRVEIASEDEARIDWRVKVIKEGEAVIRMKALTDEESDAMEMRFPCYVHGMLKMDSYSGAIPPDGQSGKFTV
ncbi:MAG: alpha-2-macroglobulin, partial [Thermoguttaceae bacterium]|nr:alpha-2-macroglobulin [Thermoguttaceae bacterium]